MTATLVQTVPEGPDWMYEVKLDGYRALILKSGSHVQIRSRNDKSLSGAYPDVDTAAKRINADSVALDGEIVAIDGEDIHPFRRFSTALPIRGTRSCTTRSTCCT